MKWCDPAYPKDRHKHRGSRTLADPMDSPQASQRGPALAAIEQPDALPTLE